MSKKLCRLTASSRKYTAPISRGTTSLGSQSSPLSDSTATTYLRSGLYCSRTCTASSTRGASSITKRCVGCTRSCGARRGGRSDRCICSQQGWDMTCVRIHHRCNASIFIMNFVQTCTMNTPACTSTAFLTTYLFAHFLGMQLLLQGPLSLGNSSSCQMTCRASFVAR